MYLALQKRLAERIRAVLQEKYGVEVENIPLEIPPDLKFGEMATPIAFELARRLRKAPKIIAQEIVSGLGAVEGFAGFETAGAGYINGRLDRAAVVRMVASGPPDSGGSQAGLHALVEHTSINPNKAAHIGHLRNAILGDTFVRLLRAAGAKVDVQNYIDNTGVQVADVVVGFLHVEGKSAADVRALMEELARKGERIDYYCWDLYARTSQWYSEGTANEQAARKKLRLDTLHAIERGGNETAEVAELISTAVLRRHLETMLRLGIEYDFLPRESEILRLKFWEAAFEQLKKSGVLYFETEGKNKGCWVMARPGAANAEGKTDEDAKVIVRSNGTVTYVGKDIAYHLWKFGLLGRDFGYKPFFNYTDRECWISAEKGSEPHPHFGGAQAIYNVIDSRQSDPQANVIQALRGMGHTAAADHYTHFSYEMVALTPRCAIELGYDVAEEDRGRSYIEVSGRKGFGVKADDLMDRLIAATCSEVDARQTGRDETERQKIAEQIAIGALRYFMLKYTRNSVIAFDFKDALSFEGETGPYVQYAVVRIRNIFRKQETSKLASQQVSESASGKVTELAAMAELAKLDLAGFLSGAENEDIWELWLRAGRGTQVLEQCIATSEPAYLAKHAFQLAQEFSNFYHRHHILTEEDPEKKTFLLATAAVTLRELVNALSLLGIESPQAM
ncbi:MAG TPA: arginine--tRNA ligase [Terracidiphilus sp.]|nr:arginine--tRNA ligase [Terracidiphilus sp.]